jgi:hypothetical protein
MYRKLVPSDRRRPPDSTHGLDKPAAKDLPMDEPTLDPDSTGDVGRAPASTRRKRPRTMLLVILAKAAIVVLFLALPSGLAISLGAAHGVALLVLLVVAAVALVASKRWGRTRRLELPHRPPHGHEPAPAWARRAVTRNLDDTSHE